MIMKISVLFCLTSDMCDVDTYTKDIQNFFHEYDFCYSDQVTTFFEGKISKTFTQCCKQNKCGKR